MDQRTATRFVSDLEIECHSIGASAPAMLYNVSTDGCMLETPFELPEEWEDHPGFMVWRQVRNGMWIRAAVFASVFGADSEIRSRAARLGLL